MDEQQICAAGVTYQLGRELGAGGFGTVFEAKRIGAAGFTKTVAIKVLNDRVQDHPELVGRLRDEARLLSKLQHHSIVSAEDLIEVSGRPALVMELVRGVDLAGLVRGEPLPDRVSAEICGAVADALAAAHDARDPATGEALGLVHRDIKPSNIRLTADGGVKVLDFGVARASFAGREAVTHSEAFGSAGYMAPERFDGTDIAASDLFALGATLFECLTGRWMGRLGVVPSRFASKLDEQLGLVNRDERLIALCREMLSYESESRPTAREVAIRMRELAPVLDGPWMIDWARHAVAEASAAASAESGLALGGVSSLEHEPVANETLDFPLVAAPTKRLVKQRNKPPVPARQADVREEPPVPAQQANVRAGPPPPPPPPRRAGVAIGGAVVAGVVGIGSLAWVLAGPGDGTVRCTQLDWVHGEPTCSWTASDRQPGFTTETVDGRVVRVASLNSRNGGAPWWLHAREAWVGIQTQERPGLLDTPMRSQVSIQWGETHPTGWSFADGYGEVFLHAALEHEDREIRVRYFNAEGVPVPYPTSSTCWSRQERLDECTGALGERWELDEQGRMTVQWFLDSQGAALQLEGRYGVRHHRNEAGLTTRTENLDASGQTMADENGVVTTTREYSDAGNPALVTDVRFFGLGDTWTLGPSGCHHIQLSYDEDGRVTSQQCYASDAAALVNQHTGCHALRTHYGPDAVTQRCLGPDEEPTAHVEGWWVRHARLDPNGREQAIVFLDRSGGPSVDGRGVARIEQRWSEQGELMEVRSLDATDRPFRADRDPTTLARVRRDEQGRVVEAVWLGPEDTPSVDSSGVAMTRFQWNDAGRIAYIRTYDASSQPVRQASGAFVARHVWDEQGRLSAVENLDRDEALMADRHGIARTETTWDEHGRRVSTRYLDADSMPVIGPDGYHESRHRYGASDTPVSIAFFDTQGEPQLGRSGVHRQEKRLGIGGQVVELLNYGVDDQLAADLDGMARTRIDRDAMGRAVAYHTEDAQGQPVANRLNGCATLEARFDSLGRPIGQRCFDPTGAPALIAGIGAHETRLRLDAQGNRIEARLFDGEGNPMLGVDGWSSYRRTVDTQGRMTALETFGTDGLPIDNIKGISLVEQAYDARGNLVSQRHFDATGERATLPDEDYSERRMEFDAQGREVRLLLLSKEGKPVSKPCYDLRTQYNELGQYIRKSCHGPNGESAQTEWGWHRLAIARDTRGNAVKTSFYGVDGRPVVASLEERNEWYASIENTYDERGNPLSVRFFDVDGRPLLQEGGYAEVRSSFDELGSVTSKRVYGTSGEPTRFQGHFHEVRYRWRLPGQLIEKLWLDEKGSPAPNAWGQARTLSVYDERGHLIEQALYDGDGQLVAGENGYAVVTWERDSSGRPVVERWYDEKELPTKGNRGCSRLETDYRGGQPVSLCVD